MHITVIYAAKKMTLTVDMSAMSERLDITQMGQDGSAVMLRPLRMGVPHTVVVEPGVYKVMGTVTVTADTQDPLEFQAVVVDNKDDPPPDQPKMIVSFDQSKLREFIVDARSGALPPVERRSS